MAETTVRLQTFGTVLVNPGTSNERTGAVVAVERTSDRRAWLVTYHVHGRGFASLVWGEVAS